MEEHHWKSFFENDYLGSWKFKEGIAQVLTIDKLVSEEVYNPGSGKKEMKPVLSFKGEKLKMVMNVTNSERIEQIHGPYVEKWTGKRIAIYLSETKVMGKPVPCLRIVGKEPPADVKEIDISSSIQSMMKRD
jgi:hypothetical protein